MADTEWVIANHAGRISGEETPVVTFEPRICCTTAGFGMAAR
jgi:hypothetical protein